MVLLPNLIGCIFPKKMCMTGSSKVNDVLAVSATLMPSLLVIYGYKIWRGQKAKELLAEKAQKIYFELDEIVSVLDKHKDQIKSSPETITRESVIYIDVKKACDDISKSILLFKDLLSKEQSRYSSNFNTFYIQITLFEFNARSVREMSSFGGKLAPEMKEYIKNNEVTLIQMLPEEIVNIKDNLIEIILHK